MALSIRYLLFDIDDTLLNFRDAVEPILRTTMAEFDVPFGEAELATYHRINSALWLDLAHGKLTREELYAVRFAQVLAALGSSVDGLAVERRFRHHLTYSTIPEAHAEETLAYLAPRYVICAASNAPQEQQEYRLTAVGFRRYFTHVFTSGGLGVDKPSAAFFDRCLHALGDPPRDSVMMLGDSPEADILGGAAAGLKTCFVNTRGVSLPPDCHPDHTVQTLAALREFL